MLSTAIVHVPVQSKPAPAEPTTPFEGFMGELDRRFGASATSMQSAAIWTAFPYEQIVADGLWLVFIRAAERFGLKLDDPDVVLKDIAPRVNRVVNDALDFVYTSPAEAADDFERKVVSLPVGELALESAKFFGALIRESEDLWRKFMTTAKRIQRDNQFSLGGSIIKDTGLERVLVLNDVPWLANEGFDRPMDRLLLEHSPDKQRLRSFDPLAELRRVKEARLIQRALLDLPVSFARLPPMATGDLTEISLDSHWLRTQILLAVAGADARLEHLDKHTYPKGLKRIKSLSDEHLVHHFMLRMKARAPSWRPESARPLISLIKQIAGYLRSWKFQTLDLEEQRQLLIDARGMPLTYRMAMDMSLPVEPLQGSSKERSELNEELLNEFIQRKNWSELDADEFKSMLDHDVVPLKRVIALAEKLSLENLEYLVSSVLEARREEGLFPLLLQKNLVSLTTDLIDDRFGDIPADRLVEAFDVVIMNPITKNLSEREGVNLAFRLLLRMERVDASTLVADHKYRSHIGHALLSLQVSGAAKPNPSRKLVANFIGLDLYRKLILCAMINDYEVCYSGSEDDFHLPPWEERFTETRRVLNPGVWEHFSTVLLTKTKAELAGLAPLYKEDDLFLWLYEGKPDLKKRLKAYQKARAAYYQARKGR